MAQMSPFNPIPKASTRTPKTKEEVLNAVGLAGTDAVVTRVKGHVAEVTFPDTGMKFLLTVHKPRSEAAKASMRKTRAKQADVQAGAARNKRTTGRRGARAH
jgi:hypothetical protein